MYTLCHIIKLPAVHTPSHALLRKRNHFPKRHKYYVCGIKRNMLVFELSMCAKIGLMRTHYIFVTFINMDLESELEIGGQDLDTHPRGLILIAAGVKQMDTVDKMIQKVPRYNTNFLKIVYNLIYDF